MKKIAAVAALCLALMGCNVNPEYTVTEYSPDGSVRATWSVNSYTPSGNCLGFVVRGEPTNTNVYACGSVVGASKNEIKEGPAKYVVTQRTETGTVLNRWDATSASQLGSCIQFTALGDSMTNRIVCGNVVAEARALALSPDSPAPYQVSAFGKNGDVQSWRARSYSINAGVIAFYLPGDSTNTPNYVTGNAHAGARTAPQ